MMTAVRDVPGAHPPGADMDAAPGWLRGLWGFLLLHRRDLALAWAAALLGSACQAVVPLIARHIVDDVIVARTSPLWPWLLLLLAAAAGAFGFAYVRRYRGGRVALGVQFDLRNAMHDHLQTLDQDNLARLPTGQLVARANSDSALVQGLLSLLPIMMGNVLMLIATLIIMIFLSPPLALISLAVVPTLFALSYRLRSRVFPATWDAQQREGGVAQIVDEDVNGVRVVKAFGQERRELDRIVDAAGDLYGSRMRAVRLRARYQPLLEAVPAFAQVAILAVGGWMALNGHLTIGTFLAFSTYVGQFAAPARQLAGVLTVGQQARAGVERIFQLLRLTPTIADAPDAVDLGPLRGEIAFEGVEFAYRADVPILRGFDLRIAAGERVAIIGASGSGKSTVAALLSRFHDPDAGRVTVDGHDLRSVRLRSLRSQVGVAFEESFLFSVSVRENIAFGRPDASEAEVEAAARAAAAHEFIVGLPRGYDTVVGERGLSLSGGQRQRIALARALLTDPRVLVLDDATSAVDAHTEERIHGALRELLPGRTTILIAHRVSTLHLAERIVVIDGGRVVESGTHDELQERSGTYRALLAGLDAELVDELGDRVEVLATLLDENENENENAPGTGTGTNAGTDAGAGGGAGAGAARVGGRPRR
ncbi:ABC transporter related protein, partial [Parafrankia sp. EUN1f]